MVQLSSVVAALVAVAVPAVAATSQVESCNTWLPHTEIQGGGFLKSMQAPDTHWCKKECLKLDNCVAATFLRAGRVCSLYKASSDAVRATVTRNIRTFVVCPTCDKLERDIQFTGGDEVIPPFTTKDVWWCRKMCFGQPKCNAFVWKADEDQCTLLEVQAADLTRTPAPGYQSYALCDRFELLPFCGAKDGPICYNGGPCDAGLTATNDGTCDCGKEWQPCCNASCDGGLSCDMNGGGFGQCAPCGGDKHNDYQVCCPGDLCNSDEHTRRICVHGQCQPCGGQWQALCVDEPVCDRMLMPDPHAGTQCVMMGADK